MAEARHFARVKQATALGGHAREGDSAECDELADALRAYPEEPRYRPGPAKSALGPHVKFPPHSALRIGVQ